MNLTVKNGMSNMHAIFDEMTNRCRSIWMPLECGGDRDCSYIDAPPQFIQLKKSPLSRVAEYHFTPLLGIISAVGILMLNSRYVRTTHLSGTSMDHMN